MHTGSGSHLKQHEEPANVQLPSQDDPDIPRPRRLPGGVLCADSGGCHDRDFELGLEGGGGVEVLRFTGARKGFGSSGCQGLWVSSVQAVVEARGQVTEKC